MIICANSALGKDTQHAPEGSQSDKGGVIWSPSAASVKAESGSGRGACSHTAPTPIGFPPAFGEESVEYMQEVVVTALIDPRTDPQIES